MTIKFKVRMSASTSFPIFDGDECSKLALSVTSNSSQSSMATIIDIAILSRQQTNDLDERDNSLKEKQVVKGRFCQVGMTCLERRWGRRSVIQLAIPLLRGGGQR